MSSRIVLVNGVVNGSPDVLDRGLAYGDGLFETIRISRRAPLLWEQHLQRLKRGCLHLSIPLSDSTQRKLESELAQLCQSLESDEAVAKLIVTRGAGGRGYRPSDELVPQRILLSSPLPEYPRHYADPGIDLFLCETRLAVNPRLAGIKHLNRLEQVLARGEWQQQFAEGLVRDYSGRIIEGTMSNLFLIRDGRLLTPGLDDCGVNGVMRGLIIENAVAAGIQVVIGDIQLDDIESAEGLFMTNSLIGVWPVRSFLGREYPLHAMTGKVKSLIQAAEVASLDAFRNKISTGDSRC